jgi:hypothetical protein
MTVSLRLQDQEAWPVQVDLSGVGLSPKTTTDRAHKIQVQSFTAELAFRVFAAFRAHPHISNVLTHISRSNWPQVEHALNVILDPAASEELSTLAQNIVDLMCAERGVTGRILKPYFHAVLERIVEPHDAERLIRHVEALFADIERKTTCPRAVSIEPAEGHSS